MEKLIEAIKEKRELKNLDEKLIIEFLEKYFAKNGKVKKTLEEKNYNPKSKEFKTIVKEIRKKLREIYGVFIKKDFSKREKLLEELNKDNEDEILTKIMELHQSTKERLPYYREIYEEIFKITGKPKRIIDLACGINPLSYPWMNTDAEYFASDISEKDMEFLNSFFKKENIKGKAKRIDLVEEIKEIDNEKADICFLFKALDSFEARKKHISKKIIENLKTKWIVISFSKVSIGGNKTIDKNKRNWVRRFLKNEGFEITEFEVPNEVFIIAKKIK